MTSNAPLDHCRRCGAPKTGIQKIGDPSQWWECLECEISLCDGCSENHSCEVRAVRPVPPIVRIDIEDHDGYFKALATREDLTVTHLFGGLDLTGVYRMIDVDPRCAGAEVEVVCPF